jgi:hypothetical protein
MAEDFTVDIVVGGQYNIASLTGIGSAGVVTDPYFSDSQSVPSVTGASTSMEGMTMREAGTAAGAGTGCAGAGSIQP